MGRRAAALVALIVAIGFGCDPSATTTGSSGSTSRSAVAGDGAGIPNRIITIAPNADEIIAALGEGRRLAAISAFTLYPPEILSLPRVGGLFDPDLEGILLLRPDLMVLRGRSPAVEGLCRENGIRIYLDPTEDLEDIYRTISELGAMLHREAEAERLAEGMRSRLERIEAAVRGRPRPRVFVTLMRSPRGLKNLATAGSRSFVNRLIEVAGGENVFAGSEAPYPEVNLELISSARPEVIVELMPEASCTPELERRAREDWREAASIPAVRDGRISVLCDDHALIPSPRIVETIERLARVLHPEANLEQE